MIEVKLKMSKTRYYILYQHLGNAIRSAEKYLKELNTEKDKYQNSIMSFDEMLKNQEDFVKQGKSVLKQIEKTGQSYGVLRIFRRGKGGELQSWYKKTN